MAGFFVGKIQCDTQTSADSQQERWSTACGEIPMSGPLGTVLGSMQENPNVICLKNAPSDGGSGPHQIHSSLGPPESTPQWHLSRFSHFRRARGTCDWWTMLPILSNNNNNEHICIAQNKNPQMRSFRHENKWVFKCLANVATVSDETRSSVGREFQTTALEMAKAISS